MIKDRIIIFFSFYLIAKVLTFWWPWVEPETYFELVNVQQIMVLEPQGYVIAEKKRKKKDKWV